MKIRSIGDIDQIRENLIAETRTYLRKKGWAYTCDTPGSFWLWSRVYKGKTILVDEVHALSMQRAFDHGTADPEAT